MRHAREQGFQPGFRRRDDRGRMFATGDRPDSCRLAPHGLLDPIRQRDPARPSPAHSDRWRSQARSRRWASRRSRRVSRSAGGHGPGNRPVATGHCRARSRSSCCGPAGVALRGKRPRYPAREFGGCALPRPEAWWIEGMSATGPREGTGHGWVGQPRHVRARRRRRPGSSRSRCVSGPVPAPVRGSRPRRCGLPCADGHACGG